MNIKKITKQKQKQKQKQNKTKSDFFLKKTFRNIFSVTF